MKKEYWILSAGTAVFFVLAFITLLVEPAIAKDGGLYLKLAGVWHEHGNFQAVLDHFSEFWIPPLYLWLIQCLMNVGIPPEAAARGISLFCGAMMPIIVYLIARTVQDDKRVCLAAAVLTAVNPSLINYSIDVQRDMLYLVLIGWTVYFCLRGFIRKEIWSWIPAGIFFGCSLLARYETLELLPILLLAALLFALKKCLSWKRIACQFVIMCSCGIVTFLTLIYSMGVEKNIFDYYSNYFLGKYTAARNLYIPPDAELETPK